jgi:hypothetical protein
MEGSMNVKEGAEERKEARENPGKLLIKELCRGL